MSRVAWYIPDGILYGWWWRRTSGEIARTCRVLRFARIFRTAWHPVTIWCFDPAMGSSHLAPCSHLVVQKYSQPSPGARSRRRLIWHADPIWYHTCHTYLQQLLLYMRSYIVLKLRANLKSLARIIRAIFPPFVWAGGCCPAWLVCTNIQYL